MVFSPLWAVLTDRAGFPAAAMMLGLALVDAVVFISTRELARTPFRTVTALMGEVLSMPRAPQLLEGQLCPP